MRHAERTVVTFGAVCVVSAAAELVAGAGAAPVRVALIAGAAMIVFGLWAAWRRR